MTIRLYSQERNAGAHLLTKAILLLSLLFLPAPSHALEVGDKSPDFQAKTVKGDAFSYSSDFKGKKPVYLVFWTTW